MLKKLLGALLVVVIVLIGVGLMLPREIHIERSITIERSTATLFPYVNSLKRFNEWSPWTKIDPNVKISFSGPDAGVGSAMTWIGNSKVGKGSQVITESVADTRVASDLEFGGMGTAKAVWALASEGTATRVTWSLDFDLGANPAAHFMGLFVDKAVGPDYERGLAQLKVLAEKTPEAAPPADAPQPASAAPTSEKAATN